MAAILVVIATACTRGSSSAAKPTPSGNSVQASVVWTACGSGFQCGSLAVPLDYEHPNGETIKLALIRKPATDQSHRQGSVLTNPGGPGASGIDYLKQVAATMTNVNKTFDLVSWDPRGVGQSAPVRCLTAAQEDAYNALDSVLDDPIEKAAGIQADKDFAAGCQAMSGKLLPFVSTVNTARDLDRIREAVGDSKLTYLGFSYGTYVGEWYAHLFPKHVRALALDGVIDPATAPNDMILDQVKGIQGNLEAFAADCKTKSTCSVGRSGDVVSKIANFLQSLDTTPMQVGDRQLTRALAIYGIGVTLYDMAGWPYLDQGLTAALQGNGRLLLAFADLYLGRQSNGTYDNETDSNVAINCADRAVPTDIATYDALTPAFAQASALFGPAFQYGNLTCAYWPVKPTPQTALTVDGAPPILLVAGTHDPITPLKWAQGAHEGLAGSVLLTRDGYGHTSYGSSQCAQAAVDAYLIQLKVPAAGANCSS